MSALRRHAHSGAATGAAACRLHDVDDVLAYVQSVVARRAATFDQSDREEIMSYLLVEVVHMSGMRHGRYAYTEGSVPKGVYDPWGTISFSTLLGWHLPRRIIDWQRKTKGDSRNKTQVTIVSIHTPNDRSRDDSGQNNSHASTMRDPSNMIDQLEARERLRSALADRARRPQ